MASGLPDYNRGVDIKLQGLSEVIVRPKYGGGLQAEGSETLAKNFITSLAVVFGKGVLYGGTVWMDHTSTQADSELLIVLDGTFIYSPGFLRMNDYGITNSRSSIVSINKYDPVNHIYSLGMSYGLTFEEHFVVAYWEKNGTTPTVHYNFAYALI